MKTAARLVWMSLVVVGLLFAGSSYAAIDTGAIVGLWLFDEGAGDVAADTSGKGNVGALMGDPTWVDGKFGKALEFDGDGDYVDCGNADSLIMADQITVACWFKTNKDMVEFEDRQCLLGKHYLEYEVGLYPAGRVHTYTNDGTGGGYDEGIEADLPDGWTVGQWYHVAWTLNGVHETVYVDGVNIAEFDKPNAGTLGGDHPLEIGERVGGSLLFNGVIDEVVIFNAVLSEADINAIMSKGLSSTTAVSAAEKLATTWGAIRTR